MAFHELQPWCNGAAVQTQLGGQLTSRHKFEDAQNSVLVNTATGNLLLTMAAILKRQFKRRHRLPELLKVERVKPIVNILYVLKLSHSSKVSQPDSSLQILHQKGDGICLPTYQPI